VANGFDSVPTPSRGVMLLYTIATLFAPKGVS
jgi:hypothetical protein